MSIQADLDTVVSDLKTLSDAVDAIKADVETQTTEDPLFTTVKQAFMDAGWIAPATTIPVADGSEPAPEDVAASADAAA